jgi:hypothetical protein
VSGAEKTVGGRRESDEIFRLMTLALALSMGAYWLCPLSSPVGDLNPLFTPAFALTLLIAPCTNLRHRLRLAYHSARTN